MAQEVGGELFVRHHTNPILTSKVWPYPINTVFNPGAIKFKDKILLLCRCEDKRGISHLTIAKSKDGITDWEIDTNPFIAPEPDTHPEELWGVEDPRITYMEELGKFAITYVSFSRGGPLVSLALTEDFEKLEKIGPIVPPEDKDSALFPRRINGEFLLIHRPSTTFQLGFHIWISSSPDLKHWGRHKILLLARQGAYWDANKIGLGPPPLETPEGWLILYHGVKQTASGAIYRVGLALLDLENPFQILHRSEGWVMTPQEYYEQSGDVGGVVFPTGWIYKPETDEIYLYYGAADTCICLATAKLKDLLDYLKTCPPDTAPPWF